MPDSTDPQPTILEESASPSRGLRRQVAAILGAGELVALPTETVYGIAARADDAAALERLREAKGRPAQLPMTWHVATREALERFGEGVPGTGQQLLPLARRLAESYWPGPLTLVMRGVPEGLELVADDGWTGVRLPAHPTTRGLLAALDFPVVLSSANAHGGPALVEAGSVAAAFGDALRLVVDGGRCKLGEASGVLRLGAGKFELLREGLLPITELRRRAGLRIAFVCTGNTCRSPMAEGLAVSLLARRLGCDPDAEGLAAFGFDVSSMGVHASFGTPASAHAIEALAAQGIEIQAHRSQPAIAESLDSFDRVFCLTDGHRHALLALLSPGKGRHIQVLDPEGRDVMDPIGGSRRDYEECARFIAEAIERRAADWA